MPAAWSGARSPCSSGSDFATPTGCSEEPASMSKDLNTTGRWLKRITQSLSGEPQDRAKLVQLLRESAERGLLDSDALDMLEGVLEVADLQVRDIMVPRVQMVFVRLDEQPATILPAVIESGHSRFPVMDEDRDNIVGILLAKDLLRLCV